MSNDEGIPPEEMRRIMREARAARRKKEQAARDQEVMNRLEREVRQQREDDADLEWLAELTGNANLDEVRRDFRKYAPPESIEAIDALNKAIKRGDQRQAKKIAKRRRREISLGTAAVKKNKGWCSLVALLLVGGLATALVGVGWGAVELVAWVTS